MKVKKFTTIALMLFACSCAGISLEKMKSETQNYSLPFHGKKDKAVVYVMRPSMLGTFVRFNVFVDDKEGSSEMGYTRGSQYVYFFVTPGHHKIFSKAENWAEVEIDARANEEIFIKQNPEIGFIIARNSLDILNETEAKYHIKNSAMGTIKQTEK